MKVNGHALSDMPPCPKCGGRFARTTLLGCDSPPGHDHDENRLTCVNGHSYGHTCPVAGCKWKSPHVRAPVVPATPARS